MTKDNNTIEITMSFKIVFTDITFCRNLYNPNKTRRPILILSVINKILFL